LDQTVEIQKNKFDSKGQFAGSASTVN